MRSSHSAARGTGDGEVAEADQHGRDHGRTGSRTGTSLACLAVLDGVSAAEAVAYVRARYDCRAVETPWQHRYADRFEAS